jgi:hypothetical protein
MIDPDLGLTPAQWDALLALAQRLLVRARDVTPMSDAEVRDVMAQLKGVGIDAPDPREAHDGSD